VEICDPKYSIRAYFSTASSMNTLKEFLKNQSPKINLLSILGKQVKLKQAWLMCYVKQLVGKVGVGPTSNMVGLKVMIEDFEILNSYWDCTVPPSLQNVYQDPVVTQLLANRLVTVQRESIMFKLAGSMLKEPISSFR
jgi:hypothetical protein